jgi:triacylglycerol lipase
MIIGDQEDEGTLFSLFQSNITNSAQLITYLSEYFFHSATIDQITNLVATYPDDWLAGSPFNTGLLNAVYPEFKRLAAILGDLSFTLTRRLFLAGASAINPSVPSWSYLSSYDYGTPIMGTFHASDILQVFYGVLPNYASASIQSYYISFLYTMDPNNGTSDAYATWPQWSANQELMNFFSSSSALLADNFRNESYAFVGNNVASLRI